MNLGSAGQWLAVSISHDVPAGEPNDLWHSPRIAEEAIRGH